MKTNWRMPTKNILPQPERSVTNNTLGITLFDSMMQEGEEVNHIEELLVKSKIPGKVKKVTHAAAVSTLHIELDDINHLSRTKKIAAEHLAVQLRGVKKVLFQENSPYGHYRLEIVRPDRRMVHFVDVLDDGFMSHDASANNTCPFVIGEDFDGNIITSDMEKATHMIIAGATQSGKSVALHSIINSIMMTTPPDKVQFLMADLKGGTELSRYEGSPFLGAPVATNPSQLVLMLDSLCNLMDDTYEVMAKLKWQKISKNEMHFIFILDELAKAMLSDYVKTSPYRDESVVPYKPLLGIEPALQRLLRLGSAAGIHVILATDSPRMASKLKVNIPTKIAFLTSEAAESKSTIGQAGAEKLAGEGDCLLLHAGSRDLIRVQAPYISSDCIDRVASYWKHESKD